MEAAMVETVLGMTDLQIKLFTAIGQIAVACIVGYIAYQQWRLAQKKLKADLFDRRYAAYKDLVKHVHALTELTLQDMDAVERSQLLDYYEIYRVGREMAWLFEEATSKVVRNEVAIAAQKLVAQLVDLPAAKNPSEAMELRREIMRSQSLLSIALGKVTEAVSPFLQLHH